uniref:Uncharacterized protein n=1 Tax=Lepeophtheirus salmonis TaxID=72036 RepID=A0A0K2U205_LEPSM
MPYDSSAVSVHSYTNLIYTHYLITASLTRSFFVHSQPQISKENEKFDQNYLLLCEFFTK